MCPARYCRSERAKPPAIIPRLKGGRAERFERFIHSIHASRRPTLWMKHALLPHGPWVYLPDGRMLRPPGPELRAYSKRIGASARTRSVMAPLAREDRQPLGHARPPGVVLVLEEDVGPLPGLGRDALDPGAECFVVVVLAAQPQVAP